MSRVNKDDYATFVCPDCGYEIDCTIENIVNNGTPQCPHCDDDLKLKE